MKKSSGRARLGWSNWKWNDEQQDWPIFLILTLSLGHCPPPFTPSLKPDGPPGGGPSDFKHGFRGGGRPAGI